MVIEEEIEEILERQKARSLALRTSPLEDRLLHLRALQNWIENHLTDIREALYADFRKPEMEVNITEIFPALSEIRQAIAQVPEWAYPKKVKASATFMGSSAQVYYEPKGVCLIISPWNYPFVLAVGPMISALAAGNTVILKPSEYSPNTSSLLERMAQEVFDADIVKVFTGDVEVARSLLEHPFDHIFFTGSSATGKKIMKAAAEHLSSVTLELGGKSPAIVDGSATVADSAEKISWGKFLNTGQTCIAPDYVLVHESIKDSFIRELIFYTEKRFGNGGNDYKESPDFARIINENHFDRLQNALEDTLQKGGSVLYGGAHDRESLFFGPTLVTDVPEKSILLQEEIFGPLLPIVSYSSLDEAINLINSKPKPLASYLFSQNEEAYQRILTEISSGGLVLNDCVVHFSHPHLPFGGVNSSGIGKSHGKYGFLEFSNEKAVLRQRLSLNRMVYPPYSQTTGKIVNYILKYL